MCLIYSIFTILKDVSTVYIYVATFTHKTTHIQASHTMHMMHALYTPLYKQRILQCTHNTHTYLRNVQPIVYQPLTHIAINYFSTNLYFSALLKLHRSDDTLVDYHLPLYQLKGIFWSLRISKSWSVNNELMSLFIIRTTMQVSMNCCVCGTSLVPCI